MSLCPVPHCALVVLPLFITSIPGFAQSLTLYLPENAEYHYVNATPETSIGQVPPDWYLPNFDDSTWFVGLGAFGVGFGGDLPNAHGPDTPDAPQFPGGTPWSVHHDPFLRTAFELPAAMDLTLWIAVDNGVESIYLNGILTGLSFNAEGPAQRWEHVVDIPASFVQQGTNHIALQIEDHGVATGFAMVITEDDAADNPNFGEEPGTPYCFGIGCPCNNDDPNAGCANSSGVGSLLSAAGTTSVVTDDLVLILDHLPSSAFGIVYVGPNAVSVPFGDGLRCVHPGPPGPSPGTGFLRFPIRNAGPDGKFFEGPGLVAYSEQHFPVPFLAGSTWHFQGYYRDPTGPCASTFNLTNALTIDFQ